jgi:hypothetical protein
MDLSIRSSEKANEAEASMTLQNAAFALKLLPCEACPLIVWLTDGVQTVSDTSAHYDSLFMLMNREDTPCHVVHLASSTPHAPFGFIPDDGTFSLICRHTISLFSRVFSMHFCALCTYTFTLPSFVLVEY